jgi:hypothetical protein
MWGVLWIVRFYLYVLLFFSCFFILHLNSTFVAIAIDIIALIVKKSKTKMIPVTSTIESESKFKTKIINQNTRMEYKNGIQGRRPGGGTSRSKSSAIYLFEYSS